MSFDLSQFHAVFFEEAGEHLAALEAGLLEAAPEWASAEVIAELFRRAHSIKGAAATFGFDDMAGLTHTMESLLDAVRKGRLPLDRARIDACLAGTDVLRGLLAGHRDHAPIDPAAARAVGARLEALCLEPGPAATADRALELVFVLSRLVSGNEVLIENMLDELGRVGELVAVERPSPGEGAEWRVRLRGDAREAALRSVLDFMVEPGSLRIGPVAAVLAPAPAPAATPGMAEEADDGSWGIFEPLPGEPATPAHGPGEARAANLAPSAPAARAAGADNSIRVSVDKVDHVMNLVGELVITQSMLEAVASEIDPGLYHRLMGGIAQLQRNTRELQESVMAIRMLPVSTVFARFPRMVRDLAGRLGKDVELRMAGGQTELDKAVIERIADPLTHLVRNCLDHGIEAPDARRAAGKPPTGLIRLEAAQHGGHVVIEVADDGAGLDRERILARARERGLAVSDAMPDEAVWALVFEPGFSTAEVVTELSGRGVGMDVVQRSIGELGGYVEIRSEAGRGVVFTVRLPLTLSIVDGMTVSVGGEIYVVPLRFVSESLQPSRPMVRSVGGAERMLEVRGDYLPVLALGEHFGVPGAVADWTAGIMVLVEVQGERLALFVDALLGQQQVVVKSLEANFRRVDGFAGATILGDGQVALILDLAALAARRRRGMPIAA